MLTLVSSLCSAWIVGGTLLTPPSWTLRWSAPDSCPSREEVASALSDALATAPTPATLVIDARVQKSDGADLRLDIEFIGSLGGRRTLSGRDCKELTDAAVLVISIAMSHEALGDDDLLGDDLQAGEVNTDKRSTDPVEQADPPAPGIAEPSPTRRPFDPEPAPSKLPDQGSDPPKRRSWGSRTTGFFRAGAGANGGHLPRVAAHLAIEAGITGRAWRTSLTFSGSPPREIRSASNPSVGAEVSLWSLSPSACRLARFGEFAFPLCLGVDVGAMRASGTGALVSSETASSLWSAGRLSAGLMWSRRSFGLWLALSGSAAITRPAFRTEQTPLVFRAGGFGAQIAAGVELRLPSRRRR